MQQIIDRSAIDLARAIREKELSAVEVTSAFLARIAAVNPALNAVVVVRQEQALAEARLADEAIARGADVGPLHGVPMTVKDSFETQGVVTAAGTTGLARYVPERDATVVARLKAAGAILLGKTNVPELTLRFATDNHVYGRTNNPYDVSRSPGGSSGGAAAIVAAAGAAFDIGTDLGGSIRVPAHFCGVPALKSTAGRVPRTGHIPFLGLGPIEAFVQAGPIARHVEDLLPLLRVVAGPDAGDPAVVPMPAAEPGAIAIDSLRIALYTDNGVTTPSDATVTAVEAAASALRALGAKVTEAVPPGVTASKPLWVELLQADGGAGVRELLASFGTERMHPLIEWTQERPAVSATDLVRRLERANDLRRKNLAFMDRFDAIVCPVTPDAAPHHDEPTRFDYTYHYNLLGWPVAVTRCGLSADGLPIGVQIAARPWREDLAVAIAHALERALGGWRLPGDAKR